jgi:hypothetical protein
MHLSNRRILLSIFEFSSMAQVSQRCSVLVRLAPLMGFTWFYTVNISHELNLVNF